MRTGGKTSFSSDASFETRCDAMLLGRLGRELAHVYHDTLHAPLPAALRALIDQLEAALDTGEGSRPQVASAHNRPLR
ncbi:hypothetical protein [Enterovirga aerilata]|uniref:Anti-sigma factor NepR domain-containing protein n=1 Tax=Enterovirga aerilata TaxID=2730920 RepID=A0A849I235_9HYPH|nr:hypothetical protein [Enterovirga sp. DB1703]NNM71408.1 hypothetical protein [Enterovirga sp. DB1703]